MLHPVLHTAAKDIAFEVCPSLNPGRLLYSPGVSGRVGIAGAQDSEI